MKLYTAEGTNERTTFREYSMLRQHYLLTPREKMSHVMSKTIEQTRVMEIV